METNELNENTFKDVLTAMAGAFSEERHKKEPYKEMFKAGSTHTGLLRELESKMKGHVFDACDVYKEKHGIEINTKQYHVLLALPLLVKIAERDAENNEGTACCVDKAYFIISEQLIGLAGKQ